MMAEVKICGLKTRDALDCAIEAGAAMAGFVFFPKSPRHVTVAEAADLVGSIAADVVTVGLMVDPTDDQVRDILTGVPLNMIQLHGDESPERVAEVKSLSGLPVMKAIAVASPDDVDAALAYDDIADRLLFDAKPPKDMKGALPGGNALSFDWHLMKSYVGKTPWMLAGGLTPDNVVEALRISGAQAVDVSSGVECAPGIKDLQKIRDFVGAVRSLG